MKTISIIDDNGKMYEFEKPTKGYAKYYVIKLLEVVGEFIIGYVKDSQNSIPKATMWRLTGSNQDSKYNLTLIKE